MKGIKIIDIQVVRSNKPEDGFLVIAESPKNIPFEIKRVYSIVCNGNGTIRGRHAHKKLKQTIICSSGSCVVSLDNGFKKDYIKLDSPTKGLLFTGDVIIWREIYNFSDNCVVTVFADEVYNENDYIRDYAEFLATINQSTK